jgi:hypothetical protein
MQFLRIALAGLAAAIATLILFAFVGVFLPVWIMVRIHGSQAVQDAPAHGGGILFVSLPIAGIVSIPAFILIARQLYSWFRFSSAGGSH